MSEPREWLKLESGMRDPAFNMALDEALLEAMPRLGQPVLRFYGWTEPAASFGYFQRYAEVEQLTPLRPLVRRPTGGGIVPHNSDWTYSVAVPPTHPWYSLTAVESYRRIHEWIRDGLAKLAIEAELAVEASHDQPGQCFVGYERFDVLLKGRKIAGAAQRRRRDGLLVQGSLQPGFLKITRAAWEEAMHEVAVQKGGIVWSRLVPDTALEERAHALARIKYSQDAHNRRR